MILAFSVNEQAPEIAEFVRSGELGRRKRNGDERRIILKPKRCTFTWHNKATATNMFSFF